MGSIFKLGIVDPKMLVKRYVKIAVNKNVKKMKKTRDITIPRGIV